MEQKRNKLWREQQCKRVFKARMIYYASFEHDVMVTIYHFALKMLGHIVTFIIYCLIHFL